MREICSYKFLVEGRRKRNMTDTGNRARKTSGTQGTYHAEVSFLDILFPIIPGSTVICNKMSLRRALHFVFKIGNRNETVKFYRDILGMKVCIIDSTDSVTFSARRGSFHS